MVYYARKTVDAPLLGQPLTLLKKTQKEEAPIRLCCLCQAVEAVTKCTYVLRETTVKHKGKVQVKQWLCGEGFCAVHTPEHDKDLCRKHRKKPWEQ